MPFPTIGQARPRAADAYATADKWQGWIRAEGGHGEEWARVFHAGPQDSELIWAAIATDVAHAPVSVVRDRAPHGVVCGVDITLTINDRIARSRRPWQPIDDAPAGVLELRDRDTAMVEITAPKLDPAARIVFVPLTKLRRCRSAGGNAPPIGLKRPAMSCSAQSGHHGSAARARAA